MIKSIGFKNYRAFKNLQNLDLKPITILCGNNSCGKSTILKNLVLMNQTCESSNNRNVLCLNGEKMHSGNFKNITYQYKLKNTVEFSYSFEVDYNLKNFPNAFIIKDYLVPRDKARDVRIETGYKVLIEIKYVLKWSSARRKINRALQPVIVKNFAFRLNIKKPNGEIIDGAILNFTHSKSDYYHIAWENVRVYGASKRDKKEGHSRLRLDFSNLTPKIKASATINYPIAIFYLNEIIRKLFSSFSYLGPLREEPARKYFYEDDVVDIGVKGQNAAYLFEIECDNILHNMHFISDHEFYKTNSITIAKALNVWLEQMGISGFRGKTKDDVIDLKLHSSSYDKTAVSIADVGFGVSQIFPVLLEGLRMEEENTLLLEQPEIHLHPNLQLTMGDFLIALGLSNRNAVVETHSDHLINRMVRRIVEDDTGKLANMIGIYFISPDVENPGIREIEIDETQGIINWPAGFCDQAAIEQRMIIKAGIEKRKMGQK